MSRPDLVERARLPNDLTPAMFERYLARTGWRRNETEQGSDWSMGGRYVYVKRVWSFLNMRAALHALAMHEGREVEAVAADLMREGV